MHSFWNDCNQLFDNYKHPNYVLPYQQSTHFFVNRFRRLHHLQEKTSQRFFNWNQQLPCHTQKSQKYLIFLLLSLYVIMLSLWWLCMIVFFLCRKFCWFFINDVCFIFFLPFCLKLQQKQKRTKELIQRWVEVKIYVYYDSPLVLSTVTFILLLCSVICSIQYFWMFFPFI